MARNLAFQQPPSSFQKNLSQRMNLLRLPCSFVHWPSSQFFYLLTVISQDTNSNTIIKCNDIENGIRRAFHLDTMLQVFTVQQS